MDLAEKVAGAELRDRVKQEIVQLLRQLPKAERELVLGDLFVHGIDDESAKPTKVAGNNLASAMDIANTKTAPKKPSQLIREHLKANPGASTKDLAKAAYGSSEKVMIDRTRAHLGRFRTKGKARRCGDGRWELVKG